MLQWACQAVQYKTRVAKRRLLLEAMQQKPTLEQLVLLKKPQAVGSLLSLTMPCPLVKFDVRMLMPWVRIHVDLHLSVRTQIEHSKYHIDFGWQPEYRYSIVFHLPRLVSSPEVKMNWNIPDCTGFYSCRILCRSHLLWTLPRENIRSDAAQSHDHLGYCEA